MTDPKFIVIAIWFASTVIGWCVLVSEMRKNRGRIAQLENTAKATARRGVGDDE